MTQVIGMFMGYAGNRRGNTRLISSKGNSAAAPKERAAELKEENDDHSPA